MDTMTSVNNNYVNNNINNKQTKINFFTYICTLFCLPYIFGAMDAMACIYNNDIDIIYINHRKTINIINNYESNTEKKKLKQLNNFILKKSFQEFFENVVEFDKNNFIFNNDIESLKLLLKDPNFLDY